MATIPETILNGELSVPLAANDNSKGNLFGNRLSNPTSPVTIAMVTDALSWMYESTGSYTDAEMTAVANYLIWLMGKYGLQASNITGSGGSVTPITPGGLTPSRIDFIVSAISYIPTGDSTKTISQFAGREIDFIRGGVSQSTISTEPSYITWAKATASLTISPALAEGELISIIPS
jgi:hypothetical protein